MALLKVAGGDLSRVESSHSANRPGRPGPRSRELARAFLQSAHSLTVKASSTAVR